jgi:hypothetical protein
MDSRWRTPTSPATATSGRTRWTAPSSNVFLEGDPAIALSVALSAAGLFGLGAATALMTGRGILYSGARQLVIGGVVA